MRPAVGPIPEIFDIDIVFVKELEWQVEFVLLEIVRDSFYEVDNSYSSA